MVLRSRRRARTAVRAGWRYGNRLRAGTREERRHCWTSRLQRVPIAV